MTTQHLSYQWGFGNHLSSEALPQSLPAGQNSPQRAPYGLYAEQLSGAPFTQKRALNQRSWLYRLLPSVVQSRLTPLRHAGITTEATSDPNAMRWNPLPLPSTPCHFVDGLHTLLLSHPHGTGTGAAVYLYAANRPMSETFFCNNDGELLLVPEKGIHRLQTEFGPLTVRPSEIAIIPRGVKFQLNPGDDNIRGYVLENYGAPLTLPDLGPIGANGLANARDFFYPNATFFDQSGAYQLITKFQGQLWESTLRSHPLNVVAWHGNYAPYAYDLKRFNTINTVSFDHPDPSIFTVLTAPSAIPGQANVDFVIFPERWMVAEHTFRPPYYHRNVMSEYMGLIHGTYDAKEKDFVPGGGSLHNIMTPHGPDTDTFLSATKASLTPAKQTDTLAFMFESSLPWLVTKFSQEKSLLQQDYTKCWEKLPQLFDRK